MRVLLSEVLDCIDAEEEFSEPMPDDMWETIKKDKDAAERAFRISIRLTKDSIRNRVMELRKEVG